MSTAEIRRQEDCTYGPRDYIPIPPIERGWKAILDIGPGRFPFPRATHFVDHDPEMLEGLRNATEAEIEDGLPQFTDKQFDFIWCSHVLEHVEDLEGCCRTLSRIGKRGLVVMPSVVKEALFLFEEPQHKWLVMPHPQDGKAPICVRHNTAWIDALRDELIQQATGWLYRTGSDHDSTREQYMAEWFRAKEPWLDVAWRWEGTLELTVIR